MAKLADRGGAREAVTGFGVPDALAGPVASLLPVTELAAAVLLIPSVTARIGSGLALALMLAFSGAIARSIARGEAPDCHCFGAIHSEPAGPRTLVRNLALAALAAVAVAGGAGTSATAWIDRLSAGWLTAVVLGAVLAAVLAGGGAFALRLLRRHGELLLRIDTLEEALSAGGVAVPRVEPEPTGGLPVGAAAPEFVLPDVTGAELSLAALRAAGAPLLLLFTDPACGPCAAMLPRVAAWQRERPGGLRPVLVSRGARQANLAHASGHDVADVLIQTDHEVSESFAVNGHPQRRGRGGRRNGRQRGPLGEEQIAALVQSRTRSAPDAARRSRRPAGSGRGWRSVRPAAPALRTLERRADHAGRASARDHDAGLLEPRLRLLHADGRPTARDRRRTARRRAASGLDRLPAGQPGAGAAGHDPARGRVRHRQRARRRGHPVGGARR